MKDVVIAWDARTWAYLGCFAAVFAVSLFVDLVAHKGHKEVSMRNALGWTGVWMLVSIAFGGVTWAFYGQQAASLYISGFFLEKTLAVDNLFAFAAVFASFGLMDKKDQHLQHTILHWGIVGAIVFRVIFLALLGVILSIPSPYHEWIITVTGVIVFLTAYKMWKSQDEEDPDYSNHWSVNFVKRFFPVHAGLADGKFFVRQGKKWAVTVPFLCLVCIEFVDVIFAFDSMPAIAAVVHETPLMITSCLMAIAGLRALYFALVAMKNAFCHLEKAVIAMLVYISVKIVAKAWHVIGPVPSDSHHKALFDITPEMNLAIIALFIVGGIAASYIWPEREDGPESEDAHDPSRVSNDAPVEAEAPVSH